MRLALTVTIVQSPGRIHSQLTSRSGLAKREPEHMAQADLRRIARATRRIEAALEERDNAICTAWDSGESMRDIAKVAGLSPSRVQQIVAARRGL